MLGMMNKGGGQGMPQGMGQNPNLAALFGSNQAAAPAGAQSQLPQIMAPQIPNIGMPPRPQMPVQAAAPNQVDPMRAFAMEAAKRHMMQNGQAGRIRDDASGLPRWIPTGGRNAR